jgi:TolA-binding protein
VAGTPVTAREIEQVRAGVERLEHGLQRLETRHADVRIEVERLAREQSAERARQAAALSTQIETIATGVAALGERLNALHAGLDAVADAREKSAAGEAATGSALEALAKTVETLAQRIDELGARIVAQERSSATAQAAPSPAGPTPGGDVPGPPAATAPSDSAQAPTSALATQPPAATPAPEPDPAAAAPRVAVPRGAPPVDPRPGTERAPLDLYEAAYLDFSRGNYALAIGGFREFLKRQPNDAAADDAQYWIGEAYFSLAQRYQDAGETERVDQALQEAGRAFRAVATNYPDGDKVPAALYREALVLLAQREPASARARLEYLIERYPKASEVLAARQRIAEMPER